MSDSKATPDALHFYVITASPSDYPGKYVVRAWTIGEGRARPNKDPELLAGSLKACREHLRAIDPDMQWIPRARADDPVIVETWI